MVRLQSTCPRMYYYAFFLCRSARLFHRVRGRKKKKDVCDNEYKRGHLFDSPSYVYRYVGQVSISDLASRATSDGSGRSARLNCHPLSCCFSRRLFGCFATEEGADTWLSDGQVGMRDVGISNFWRKARLHDPRTVDSPTVLRLRFLRVNFTETHRMGRHLIASAVGQFGLRRMLRFLIFGLQIESIHFVVLDYRFGEIEGVSFFVFSETP